MLNRCARNYNVNNPKTQPDRALTALTENRYEQMDGVVPAGYEGYGADLFAWPQESSAELLALGWRAKTVEAWAASPETLALYRK